MIKPITILWIVPFFLLACQKPSQKIYTIPTTYSFDNIDYSDASIRIDMLKEFINYLESAHSLGANRLSTTTMLDLYTNNNAPFSRADLNNSNKQLKNHTIPTEQQNLESYMTALAANSQFTQQVASPGQAGIASSLDGNHHYLLNSNGIVLSQIIGIGIANACLYYQATSIYLGENKMNVDNKAVIVGKGTSMEHHWDMSFGYWAAPIDFPNNTQRLDFWAAYSNAVDQFIHSNSKMMQAYLEGRAAISAQDYDTRDKARSQLKSEWETLVVATAIAALNDAKASFGDPALHYYYLSKAYAFIMGLNYGASKNLSSTEINNILANLAGSSDPLQANFYSTSRSDITNTINSLVRPFTHLEAIKASL